VTTFRTRRTISADDIVAYSRRGNYHSDPETAQRIGLPGLVAQGVQVAGPAYGALLDAWGDEFLEHGEVELRFVGMVLADHEIEAQVEIDGHDATIVVDNVTAGHTGVVGSARRSAR
jgi:acyl dehydratase